MREIFCDVKFAVSFRKGYPDGIGFGIEDVGSVMRRMHKIVMQVVHAAGESHVFSHRIEVGTRRTGSFREWRLATELVRERAAICHALSVQARRLGKMIIPLQF